MDHKKLTVNDFFCGAGGMGLGFEQSGFKISGAWDFDSFAVQSYSENFPTAATHIDISKLNANTVPYADVWTFGFPCQDVSIQGKRKGIVESETRSGMFYEIIRLLEEKSEIGSAEMPKIILAENVKGVRKYLQEIENNYNKVGYKMYSILYNSKFWGVPQSRERYFILGVHESIEKEFLFPEQKEIESSVSDILLSSVEEVFYVKAEKESELFVDVYKSGFPLDEIIIDDTFGYGGVRIYNKFSPTLRASRQGLKVVQGGKIRRLTPREYARLQGFPDSYKQVVSNSKFYKQMGNAVTVNVAKALSTTISKFINS